MFYTAFTSGFPFLPVSDSALQVGFYASFADGTTFTENLDATEAIVVTYEQGSSGIFCGTCASWIGSGDDGVYVVTIDAPEKGIIGSFQLYSKAPAQYVPLSFDRRPHQLCENPRGDHSKLTQIFSYPCGPAVSGQNLEVGPNIGWSNAVPDATGEIEFLVNGCSLLFSGAAYHDKVSRAPHPHPAPKLTLKPELERPTIPRQCSLMVLGARSSRRILDRLV